MTKVDLFGLPAVWRAMPDIFRSADLVELLDVNNPMRRCAAHQAREAWRALGCTMPYKGGTLRTRVPFEEYRQIPGISISKLKRMKRSPAHYLCDPRSTPALTLGTAAHCKVLEPERFSSQYRIWDRRSDSGRLSPRTGKVWDLFEAQARADDFEVLTVDEANKAQAIADAVHSSSAAMRYLAQGDPEVTMQWEMQGRACKGRVDWLHVSDALGHVLVGLKSTRDCRPFYFARQAADLEFAQQWAWYWNGYQRITGIKPKVVEIAVENAAPYAVSVFVINDDLIFKGEEEYGKCLMQLDVCEKAGRWPGPVVGEEDLELPGWYMGNGDDDMAALRLEFDT